jgi:hypothetical protein
MVSAYQLKDLEKASGSSKNVGVEGKTHAASLKERIRYFFVKIVEHLTILLLKLLLQLLLF